MNVLEAHRTSLKVTGELLLLDLGEVRRLETQDGPALARYVAVLRGQMGQCLRQGRGFPQLRLLRAGVPPGESLAYVLDADPLEFTLEEGVLRLPGLRVYLEGPPPFVETPFYAVLTPEEGP